MSRLFHDIRYTLRTFIKAPGFTAVAILVLAVGIGANSATFTIVNALLLRPVAGQGEGIVGLFRSEKSKPDSFRSFAYPNYVDVREKSDVFDGLAAHTFSMAGVPAGDTTRRIFVELISANYFDTLRVPMAAGRGFRIEEERPRAAIAVAVASYDKWRARNFDPNFVGSTMKINGLDFTIVGVTPQGFTGTMALVSPEVWLPLGMFDIVVNDFFKNQGQGLSDESAGTVVVFGRLKEGITQQVATARLETLAQQLAEEKPINKDMALTVNPLPRMSTSSSPQTDAGIGVAGRRSDGARRIGPADRVSQPREHAARARHDAEEGNRDPSRARRRQETHRASVGHREPGARDRRRGCRPAARLLDDFLRGRQPRPAPAALARRTRRRRISTSCWQRRGSS